MDTRPEVDQLAPLWRKVMKFGDIVINEWAGEGNPQKVLLIVHYGKAVTCLSRKGARLTFRNDKDLRLTKIGELKLTDWDNFISKSNHADISD